MAIQDYFQIIEALAVLIGVGLAITEIRQYRHKKRREAALELLHSFQTPAFARALNLVAKLPDGLSKEQVEEHLGEEFHLVYALMTT